MKRDTAAKTNENGTLCLLIFHMLFIMHNLLKQKVVETYFSWLIASFMLAVGSRLL